jgi:hypothetical protein
MNNAVLSKRDRGAILFQTFFNETTAHFERMDVNYLKLLRLIDQLKRRVDVLEDTARLHTQTLFENEPTVTFGCIACEHTFELPLAEAKAQGFVTVCELCYACALPVEERKGEYSLREIGRLTGYAYNTACQTARELGLGLNRKQNKRFNEQEFRQIKTKLEKKTPKSKNGGENGNHVEH